MRYRYKWLLVGLGTGIFLLSLSLIFEKVFNARTITFWILIVTPVIIGILGFIFGKSVDGHLHKNRELEEENNMLQEEMTDQSLRLNSDISSVMDNLHTIVNNLDLGICFIDKEYKIEPGYNSTFIQLFGDKAYEGNSIINNVFNILDNSTKSEIIDYLDLCFINKNASSSMLNEANPVKEFEFVQIIDGAVVHTIINTTINVIKNKDNEIEKIMLIFNDITIEHELKKELEKSDSEYNKRYSIMVGLFGNDKNVIRRFINGLEEDMDTLQARIKGIKQNESNSQLIIDILGTVHSIKGEAFALGFEKLSGVAEEFENYFKSIRNKVIGLEDNLQIIGFYEKLNNEKLEFDKTISALTDFLTVHDENSVEEVTKQSGGLHLSESVVKHMQYDNVSFNLMSKELEIINNSSAKEMKKKSVFTLNTSVEGIIGKKYKILKEIFLHLIRNSVAHGIEFPHDRLASGKTENGNIILNIRRDNKNIIFEYSDDGVGFDIVKIKKRAVENGIVTESRISKMDNRDILKIIFNDGFSTSDSKNMISGTGVGMSVIKKNIFENLKGKFYMTNKPGKGINIRIVILK